MNENGGNSAEGKGETAGILPRVPAVRRQGLCREVPGMGGILSGRAFQNNVSALDMYYVNLRTIHQVEKPDTSIKLFGRSFQTPVFVAPLTGASYNMGGALSRLNWPPAWLKGLSLPGPVPLQGTVLKQIYMQRDLPP